MKLWQVGGLILAATVIAFFTGYYFSQHQLGDTHAFPNPLGPQATPEPPRPLLQYAIPRLAEHQPETSTFEVLEVLADEEEFTSYLFTYTTRNKKMSGQLNVPKQFENPYSIPTIVMIRGFVPIGIFKTGVGTRNGAAYYARHGYMTVAPDFFGYGLSDPEPDDTWLARFEKPLTVIDLLASLEQNPITIPSDLSDLPPDSPRRVKAGAMGLWGHSNGGQIALSVLEALEKPIPTTLWAPVTAPFPYSILFFTDEMEDEGKSSRKMISLFEDLYDVYDFTLTKHLDRLHAPLQLHHGTADDAALYAWSKEFSDKVKVENKRRSELLETYTSSPSAEAINLEKLQPIDLTFYTYAGADHNLSPGWDTVVERDLNFFDTHVKP
jgi:pimeloyl-ACP methyl ester carboxylesterase